MMEDWQNVNFIEPIKFTKARVTEVNKSNKGKFWIQTNINNKQVHWLADKGSP